MIEHMDFNIDNLESIFNLDVIRFVQNQMMALYRLRTMQRYLKIGYFKFACGLYQILAIADK